MVDYVLEEVELVAFPFRREYDTFRLPPGGAGYLAGTFPGGITTVDGAPVAATVRVLYRPGIGKPGDGTLIKQVQSKADGTWRVEGLNPALKFDVVGRKPGFNDVIMANVSPAVE